MRWTHNDDDNDKVRLVHLPIKVIVSLMVDPHYHQRHLCGKNVEIQIYLMTNAEIQIYLMKNADIHIYLMTNAWSL